MDKKLCQYADLEVWSRGGRFYVRYDAGAHQVVMREDEISEDDAMQATQGIQAAMKVLFALQHALLEMGINPYVSNLNG